MISIRILSERANQANALRRIFLTGSSSNVSSLMFKSTETNAAAGGGRDEDKNKEDAAKRRKSAVQASASYWGITEPKRLKKEDGTEWKWNCFKPSDTYKPDMSVDLKKHHKPSALMDRLALWTVKALRLPTDIFFKKRYGCRAVMLETVAAVPGMVGGMLLHLRSLRRFQYTGGWIRILLEEAENERMHLMTFMEVSQPRWYERLLVITVQVIFFNLYFCGYLVSPKFAHRVVGYLEEEAIYSYTAFLNELDGGAIENTPAPAIAIDYWRLPSDAKIRDVVLAVRADEAYHRDVNHYASVESLMSGDHRMKTEVLTVYNNTVVSIHNIVIMVVYQNSYIISLEVMDIQCQGHDLREWSAPAGHR